MIERFGKKIQFILRRTIFYDSYMQKRLAPFSTHVPDGQGCKLVNITQQSVILAKAKTQRKKVLSTTISYLFLSQPVL